MALKGLADLLKKVRAEAEMTEDQVEEELNKLLPESWIPKSKFNETSEQAKLLKQQLEETNNQLGTLKEKAGLSDEYKKQIDDLTAKQKTQEAEYKAQLTKLKLDTAIESALTGAKARNIKATRALLDESKVILGDDGKLAGLNEQLEAIKKDNAYLFDVSEGEGGDDRSKGQQASKMPSFGNPGGGDPGKGDALWSKMEAAAGLSNQNN